MQLNLIIWDKKLYYILIYILNKKKIYSNQCAHWTLYFFVIFIYYFFE